MSRRLSGGDPAKRKAMKDVISEITHLFADGHDAEACRMGVKHNVDSRWMNEARENAAAIIKYREARSPKHARPITKVLAERQVQRIRSDRSEIGYRSMNDAIKVGMSVAAGGFDRAANEIELQVCQFTANKFREALKSARNAREVGLISHLFNDLFPDSKLD